MPDEQRYRLEVLAAHHAVGSFRCGNEELDEYLREDALADMIREVTRTFVEIDATHPANHNIAGYFTLRADALQIEESYFDNFTADETTDGVHFAFIKVPLVELMCLARDEHQAGQHVGDTLMVDALKMVKSASDCLGVIGLHLRSTPYGVSLYERYDFQLFKEHPAYDRMRYILPIATIRAIVQELQKQTHTWGSAMKMTYDAEAHKYDSHVVAPAEILGEA